MVPTKDRQINLNHINHLGQYGQSQNVWSGIALAVFFNFLLLGLLLVVDSRSNSTSLSDASYPRDSSSSSTNQPFMLPSRWGHDAEQIHSFRVRDERYPGNLEISPSFEIIVISLTRIHFPHTCFLVNFASIRRGYKPFSIRTLQFICFILSSVTGSVKRLSPVAKAIPQWNFLRKWEGMAN
ncbi:hypothetical protein Tco_1550785 [Tanacetum coccineum]